MQPLWRKNGNGGRETPHGESWETLRKGGTAGIYVVVMGGLRHSELNVTRRPGRQSMMFHGRLRR